MRASSTTHPVLSWLPTFRNSIRRNTLKKEISNVLPKHIERFAGELFAQIYDGTYEYFYSKDFDIDFIIKRRKKVLAVGEVKWTKPRKNDIDNFISRRKHISGDKIFFSKVKVDDKRVVSLTPDNILEWIKSK